MVRNAMDLMFKRLFDVLRDQAGLTALVPNENIKPSHDDSPMVTNASPKCGSLTYTWTSAAWNPRTGQGQGILSVLAEHPESAIKCEQVMEYFRRLAKAETLSNDADINVAFFEEQPDASEPLPPRLEDANAVQTTFKVLLTYGPDYVES